MMTRQVSFTKLSSETVLQNKELPEVAQSGMHLVESCHPSERTEQKKHIQRINSWKKMALCANKTF